MSIKKTWFSYILWLFATGFSVLFTYSYITGIVDCYNLDLLKPVYCRAGLTAAFVLGVILIYITLGWIRNRINVIFIPKWGRRMLHILILCGMSVVFVITRYIVLWNTTLESVVARDIYEAAKVIAGNGQSVLQKSYYVLEEIYINILSVLFLFLGNKVEIMLYFQIFLQVASFLLLLFVGRTLQKGFLGWIPAIVYTLSPYCINKVINLRTGNFFFFLSVLCIALICILEKAWKKKAITYSLIVLFGIGFAVINVVDVLPHMADWNDVFGKLFSDKFIDGSVEGFWSFLILTAMMFFYCISFWKEKTDNVSAYILPVAGFAILLYLELWVDNSTVFLLIRIYFSFMAAEGLRILFSAKPKILTGQNAETFVENNVETEEKADGKAETNDFTWEEMQSIMEQKEEKTDLTEENSKLSEDHNSDDIMEDEVSEDTGVIRVSDILKAVGVEENISAAEEASASEESIDKTALIENVLPMPKKHVTRSFEYAFEPTEELMHYDVEVENDDYDYE